MDQETYIKERFSLIEAEHSSSDQHDKAVLTLSAGALGLSITFIEKFAPDASTCTSWLILLAWLCFIGSICFVLFSFHLSQIACRKQREVLDKIYSSGNASNIDENNPYASWTEKINFGSFGLFILGVIFLTLFAWFNLPTGKQ